MGVYSIMNAGKGSNVHDTVLDASKVQLVARPPWAKDQKAEEKIIGRVCVACFLLS